MQAVNRQRIEHLLQGLAQFGAGDNGITRLAYSETDKKAQQWLLDEIKDLHLTIKEDAVGNVFLRRAGSNSELAPVATGSHLDTVINGGAYDGMCGVVSAIEALYMLRDEQLLRSVEIIIFRAEESSRFGFATIGSKLLTGCGSPEQFSSAPRKGDLTFQEALVSWGCVPDDYKKAVKVQGDYKCFAELHIEQGRVLEEKNIRIGIVRNIAAPTRFKIHVYGMADHSGATPMGMRKDALVGGAKLILAVEAAAMAEKEHGTVATVGVLDTEPGSINVVPGKVILWVDLRGVDESSITRAFAAIKAAAGQLAEESGLRTEIELLTADKPVGLSRELAERLTEICSRQGCSCLQMHSGAGHDAMHMAKITPTTMIFIPCKNGISHNKDEYASLEDICLGTEILARFLKREASE